MTQSRNQSGRPVLLTPKAVEAHKNTALYRAMMRAVVLGDEKDARVLHALWREAVLMHVPEFEDMNWRERVQIFLAAEGAAGRHYQ